MGDHRDEMAPLEDQVSTANKVAQVKWVHKVWKAFKDDQADADLLVNLVKKVLKVSLVLTVNKVLRDEVVRKVKLADQVHQADASMTAEEEDLPVFKAHQV